MEITGKIIVVLPPQSGVSQAGNNWKKQEYVLETEETYPKKVHFDFFGERADQYNWIKIGDRIRLSFDIESREYNNRWYTSIRGWKAEKADDAAATTQQRRMELSSIRRCFITYRECNANNTPHSHDAQRGDADSCLHPPAYFFRQDRRPTSSHKAAPRRATQDIRRQADADRHW